MSIASPLILLLLGPWPTPALARGPAQVRQADPLPAFVAQLPNGARGPAAQRGAVQAEVRVVGARPGTAAPAASAPRPPAAPALGPAARRMASVPPHDLDRARSLFDAADRDHDGQIEAAEARLAGIGQRQYEAFDDAGDGAVSADDFILGYHGLVASAGRQVEGDLKAEATRLSVLRRVRSGARLPSVPGGGLGGDDQSGILRADELRRRSPTAREIDGTARQLLGG
ncbi:MAG: EF-hand domain-containing protein [Planctomycetota bacterium]